MEYAASVYKFPTLKDNILDHKGDFKLSANIDYPSFSLGFQYFLHQSKAKMSILDEFKNKKKVWFVLNPFERYIDDYEYDIGGASKVYFDVDPKPDILSRAFYKLWELLMMFDIIPLDTPKYRSVHLCEGPGSFIQAVIFYRDKVAKKGVSKDDKYHAITLHCDQPEDEAPEMEKKFLDYYQKEKPNRFILHKTYPKKEMGDRKDNGDITSNKTIKNFVAEVKDKVDLITADGGFPWKNENTQEQEAFRLILGQTLAALKLQKKGGTFICKTYELFTYVSAKILCLLGQCYGEVFITKPLMSRQSNSEKYIVCMNFMDNRNVGKTIEFIEKVLDTTDNIVEIFPSFELPVAAKAVIIQANIEFANEQFVAVNNIADFINKQNYRGEVYQKSRDIQIEAAKFWTDAFFPDVKVFAEKKGLVVNKTIKTIKDNEEKTKQTTQQLEFA